MQSLAVETTTRPETIISIILMVLFAILVVGGLIMEVRDEADLLADEEYEWDHIEPRRSRREI